MDEYANLCKWETQPVAGIAPWIVVAPDRYGFLGPGTDWEHFKYGEAIKQHVDNFSCCIQAGGCMGIYPRLLGQLFRRVHTFEPHPINFHCLVANCQQDNIIKTQAALSNYDGVGVLQEHSLSNTGQHFMSEVYPQRNKIESLLIPEESSIREIPVKVIKIDSLALLDVGFIMLDVELNEFEVLQGAIRTLTACSPVIMCETVNSEATAWLKRLGYSLVHNFAEAHESGKDGIWKIV